MGFNAGVNTLANLRVTALTLVNKFKLKRQGHQNTGLTHQKLHPCPKLPNCVCTQYPEDKLHYSQPWRYNGSRERALKLLVQVLKDKNRAEILEKGEGYVHSTFTIPVFGFVDDVEFYLPEGENIIHFRSASRVGTWDLGQNKRRMKKLKTNLVKAGLEIL